MAELHYYFDLEYKLDLSTEQQNICVKFLNVLESPVILEKCQQMYEFLISNEVFEKLKYKRIYNTKIVDFIKDVLYHIDTLHLKLTLEELSFIHDLREHFIPYMVFLNYKMDKYNDFSRTRSYGSHTYIPIYYGEVPNFLSNFSEGKLLFYTVLFKEYKQYNNNHSNKILCRLCYLLNVENNIYEKNLLLNLQEDTPLVNYIITHSEQEELIMYVVRVYNDKELFCRLNNEIYSGKLFYMYEFWNDLLISRSILIDVLRTNRDVFEFVNKHESIIGSIAMELPFISTTLENYEWILDNLHFNNLHLWYMWNNTFGGYIDLHLALISYAKKHNTYKKEITLPSEQYKIVEVDSVVGAFKVDKTEVQVPFELWDLPIDYSIYIVKCGDKILDRDIRFKNYLIKYMKGITRSWGLEYFDIPFTCEVSDVLLKRCTITILKLFIEENLLKCLTEKTWEIILKKCNSLERHCKEVELIDSLLDLGDKSCLPPLEDFMGSVYIFNWYIKHYPNTEISNTNSVLFSLCKKTKILQNRDDEWDE